METTFVLEMVLFVYMIPFSPDYNLMRSMVSK